MPATKSQPCRNCTFWLCSFSIKVLAIDLGYNMNAKITLPIMNIKNDDVHNNKLGH